MVRIFLLTVSINIMALGVALEDPSGSERNVTSFETSLYPPVEGDFRFGGSSGLFFLHLLKHKLYKLQQLDRIQTTTEASSGCICVPYYQCDINNNIILTGMLGPLDVRYRQCTGNFEVCCYLRIVPTTVRPTMTMATNPRPTMTMATNPRPTMTMATNPRPTMTMATNPRPTMTNPRPTQQPTFIPPNLCYCVFTFQCINGYLIPNAIANLPNLGPGVNPRQNQVCTQPNQVCCRVYSYPFPGGIPPTQPPIPTRRVFPSLDPRPNIPSLTSSTLPTLPQAQIAYPNFSPGQTCICIQTVQCNVFGYIPISGSGSFNPLYGMSSLLPIGSSCPSSQETCCRVIFSQPAPQLLSVDSQNQEIKFPGTLNACRCVQSLTCPGENIVYPEGFQTIDSRFGICLNEGEVCCRLENFEIIERASTTPVGLTDIFSDIECGFSTDTFAPAEPLSATSGRTYFAEFPWMVAILLRNPGQNDAFLCGGSLISPKAVLTAGHCMENKSINNLIARFGEWDTKSTEEPLPFQEAEVETVIMHPEFFNAALYHDVAILILKTAVTYAINVMPICLSYQGQDFNLGTRCYATGWGRSSFGAEGEYQSVLRKIDLPLINHEDCQNRLRTTRLGPYFQLHGSFICAGGEDNRDTCRGDGGGPLVCPRSTGQYEQVGIVSWGIGCGTTNPAVYANVAQHKLWIDQQLANYGV